MKGKDAERIYDCRYILGHEVKNFMTVIWEHESDLQSESVVVWDGALSDSTESVFYGLIWKN